MDYQWKSREPIRILNEELAEFDVVKFDLTEKKVSYVSGELWFQQRQKSSAAIFCRIKLKSMPTNELDTLKSNPLILNDCPSLKNAAEFCMWQRKRHAFRPI